MIRCSRCDSVNDSMSAYCIQCGTQLGPGIYEYASSAPFTYYAKEGTDDQSRFGTFPPPLYTAEVRPKATGKKVLNIIIAAIIFCIGDFTSSFGLMGGLFSIINNSLAFLLGICLLFASFIVFAIVITQHNVFYLRWWLKILLAFAATGILFIASIAVSILFFDSNNTLWNVMLGASVMFYGIIVEVIALC